MKDCKNVPEKKMKVPLAWGARQGGKKWFSHPEQQNEACSACR
jgi:hypothetical protein